MINIVEVAKKSDLIKLFNFFHKKLHQIHLILLLCPPCIQSKLVNLELIYRILIQRKELYFTSNFKLSVISS